MLKFKGGNFSGVEQTGWSSKWYPSKSYSIIKDWNE